MGRDAGCIDGSEDACRGTAVTTISCRIRPVAGLIELKGAGHEATPDLSWRLVLSASRTPRLARTLAPPRRADSDSDSDAVLTCTQATQDHLSYRWPNCATLSGLLCCCRLSIYTSAASDISGKLREARGTQFAAVAAAHRRPTRTPDDIDRDSKCAQHHETIVAWCVAVHVCANQVNSSSDAVPLHL